MKYTCTVIEFVGPYPEEYFSHKTILIICINGYLGSLSPGVKWQGV
jgi:hypothetical protein